MRISEQRLEAALVKLAETDETHAKAKMEMLMSEAAAEAIKDAIYLAQEGSIEDKKAKARTDPKYQEALTRYFVATRIFTALSNKRKHEELVVDVYRTMEASRRVGNV